MVTLPPFGYCDLPRSQKRKRGEIDQSSLCTRITTSISSNGLCDYLALTRRPRRHSLRGTAGKRPINWRRPYGEQRDQFVSRLCIW
ncbi:hypothetical protein M514_01719, partial [Trichuris suis]